MFFARKSAGWISLVLWAMLWDAFYENRGASMTQGANRHAAFAISAIIALTAAGCASSKSSTRMVDDPAGEAVTYGAPTDVAYVAGTRRRWMTQ